MSNEVDKGICLHRASLRVIGPEQSLEMLKRTREVLQSNLVCFKLLE